MPFQPGVSPVYAEDFPRIVEVWEASVRATHHFVREADIDIFRPMVRDALPKLSQIVCVRDQANQVVGFTSVADGNVDMLFIHPSARGHGLGKRLLLYAITIWGATTLDVNEQNEQALGFYLHLGFKVVGRSERDGTGKPYPLLHLRYGRLDAGDHTGLASNIIKRP